MLGLLVQNQSHRAATHLRGKLLRRIAHQTFFSGEMVSANPGAVQSAARDTGPVRSTTRRFATRRAHPPAAFSILIALYTLPGATGYSTVTDFARLCGLSMSQPRFSATWQASSCSRRLSRIGSSSSSEAETANATSTAA